MRLLPVIALLVLLCGALPSVAEAEPCISTHGAETPKALVARVLQILVGPHPRAMNVLAVDECVWRRAQWLLGVEEAEKLARSVRSDALVDRYHGLQRDLASFRSEKPVNIGNIEIAESTRLVAQMSGPSKPFLLKLKTVEVDGRWYVEDHLIDIRRGQAIGQDGARLRLQPADARRTLRRIRHRAGSALRESTGWLPREFLNEAPPVRQLRHGS